MLNRRQLIFAGGLASRAAAAAPVPLWIADSPVPNASDLDDLPGVRFHVIKEREPEADGYSFLHGVALAWHNGTLCASFGHNKGKENTAGEEARGRSSRDGGRTWGDVFTIDTGEDEAELAVSHGVFHSHRGSLWAFMGSFHGDRQRVHTRAYTLDESRQTWTYEGVAVDAGFWPMQQPLRMPDGNWIMAGFRAGDGDPAAVAISDGTDFMKWRLIAIPQAPGLGKMWGESTIVVAGNRILNIARYGDQPIALTAESGDYGRTWTPSTPSNLPMVTSKPYAGTLSNGMHYLIGTTAADSGRRRSPLTIALSRPGDPIFRRIYRIQSDPRASLSYPYAVEHGGHLYVGYSNNQGRVGMNLNRAELAVIPVAALRV